MKTYILLPAGFLIFIFSIVELNAQGRAVYNNAENFMAESLFEKAAPLYLSLYKENPNNGQYAFKTAYCYFNIPTKKDSSIAFLLKAGEKVSNEYKGNYKDSLAPPETFYYTAQYYHKNFMFDEAITYYRKYKNTEKKPGADLRVERKIEECIFGQKQTLVPKDLVVYDLGPIVGSSQDDHSPIIVRNGNEIIFTSKRSKNEETGQYEENVYSTKKIEGHWQKPIPIKKLNTDRHDASAGISPDGKRMYLYKDVNKGDIYISRKGEDGEWSKPEPLPGLVNTRFRETHISVSRDESLLFFSSDRPGGYGKSDIYVSKKLGDGTWGEPTNLGENVNTQYNEEGAFIAYDNKTLYFSSDGHLGMGGYDLFVTHQNNDGTWGKPENLGYPANSPSDDVFYFIMKERPDIAYYVSNHHGTTGSTNIYSIIKPEEYKRIKDSIDGTVWYPKAEQLPGDVTIFHTGKETLSEKDIESVKIRLHREGVDTSKITLNIKKSNRGINSSSENTPSFAHESFKNKYSRSKLPPSMTNDEDAAKPKRVPSAYIVFVTHPDEDALLASVGNEDLTPVNPHSSVSEFTPGPHSYGDRTFPSGYSASFGDENKSSTELTEKKEAGSKKSYLEFVIYFGYNRTEADIDENFKAVADKLKQKKLQKIEVFGHTDAKGANSYNYNLAFKRITFIENFLFTSGAEDHKVFARSFGESDPVAPNQINGQDNTEGRKKNRRVVVKIYYQ